MAREAFRLFGRISLQGLTDSLKDVSKLEQGVNAFSKKLNKIGRDVSKVGMEFTKNFTAPITAATAAVGLLAVKAGNYSSNILSLSESTGLSTDTLQEFSHVARAAGTSADGVFNIISKLSNKLPDIANGTGKAAEALHHLGINVTNADGSLRSMDDLFPEVIKGLQGIEDVTTRNTVAQEIFGGRIKDLAPVLGMSSAELENLRKQAHDTGVVMGGDALKQADDFRIEVENLKARVEMLGMEFAIKLMPLMKEQLIPLIETTLIPLFQKAVEITASLAQWFGNLPAPIQQTVIVITAIVAAVGPLLVVVGKLISYIGTVTKLLLKLKPVFLGVVKVAKVVAIAVKGVVVAIGAIPAAIGVAVAAIGVLTFKWIKARKELNNVRELNNVSQELLNNANATREAAKEYEKLRGTEMFDEAHYRELVEANVEAGIALENNARQRRHDKEMSEEQTEAYKRHIRTLHGVIEATEELTDTNRKSEYQLRQEAEAEKERQKQREDAARRAREEARRRREELENLVNSHSEAYENMWLCELGLLQKQEEKELDRARSLGASEQQLDVIRRHFSEQQRRLQEEDSKKYQEYIDNKIAEAQRELEELEAQLEREENIRLEANEGWQSKLFEQRIRNAVQGSAELHNLQRESLEIQYLDAMANAHKTGADLQQVETYYQNERKQLEIRINSEIVENRRAMLSSFVSHFSNAINSLGSVLSGFTRNEELRLSQNAKKRKEWIEQNVEDEEERAARLAELQEEEEQKKLELQRKQAERNKKINSFNIVVDTASAIVRTLRDLGPLAGTIAASVIGGLGVAQLAIVQSEPLPFFDGGLIKGSPSGITANVGEKNQSELIMPLDRGIEKIVAGIESKQAVRGNNFNSTVHVHVGTMIANDHGIKQLGKKINEVIVNENRRTGRG